MSYARFSETSNVYVYAHYQGFIECCGCILGDDWSFHSIPEIVAHMQAHVEAGHTIPDYLLDPETYDEDDFTAMCGMYLCRKDEGHSDEHTPVKGERDQSIRDRLMAV